MKRLLTAGLLALAFVGLPASPAVAYRVCDPAPGAGVLGVCTPKSLPGVNSTPINSVLLPDVSEYQGCLRWRRGVPGVIFRVYEAGTGLQDRSARCNATRLRQIGAWDAAYAFLRPGSCTRQADRTVAIVRGIGGVSGPVVADAEVTLPTGFVSCYVDRVRLDTGNGAQVIYTAPGTWPGGPLTRPLWVATYGSSPGCVAGVCSHVAWQFSDSFNCDGYFGDCSVATGIRRILQRPPHPNALLLAEREALRGDLTRHRCRVAPYGRGRYHRVCSIWLRVGQRVGRELG